MVKKTNKYAPILALVIAVIATQVFNLGFISVSAQAPDPIPDYIGQVNMTNLIDVATTLVTQYGPRFEGVNRPFVDASCTLSTSITYPKNNIEMASDYVQGLFEAMGYPSNSITMELVPQGAGHNVYVTKVGTVYPNVYIEITAHLDSVMSSPGGGDNASGSTAVIELARVLKDYPNRYSMRFILFVGEEYNDQRDDAYFGSNYHVQQALARGEQIKAGLNMDSIGRPYADNPTGYMNGISYNNAASERIADLFDQVTTQYGIDIGVSKLGNAQNSDQISYWNSGQTAVGSGGWSFFYNDPNYHNCGDTLANLSFDNTLRVAQQNLAVGLKLDAETSPSPGTPTATSLLPTSTNMPVTFTPTFTPTGTLNPPTGFPSTAVLDNFDRANGAIGANWAGTTSGYSIASNRLDVGTGEASIFWQGASFGPEQEVFVTLSTIDSAATEHDLLLKSQSGSTWSNGVLEVIYDAVGQRVQVWTYSSAQNWVQRGADIPVTFVNGDQFGARAKANGMVEVYRNGTLLGSRDASGWTYATSGGYLGLWFVNAGNAVLDDFGGGTVVAGQTFTPTNTPVPPTATNTATFTSTSTPTFTPTATSTATPTSIFTSTSTPTATQTSLFTPTATSTATPTATFTSTSTPTATFTPTSTGATITVGETSVLSMNYSGLGNRLVAQQVTLSQSATIQSLSYYVGTASGQLRLGIYNNAGSNPGTLLAQTAAFTPVVGWNTQPVPTPTLLPAGTYWLAFLPQNNSLAGRVATTGTGRHYTYTFGALPASFSSSPTSGAFHFSLYATLSTGPVPSNTPSNTPTITSTPTNTPTRTPTGTATPSSTPTNTPLPGITPTATYTPTPSNTPTGTATGSSVITIGETSVLSMSYSGLGNRLVAQQVTLSQSATIQSLSYYVGTASGQLRLGIYDNSGTSPGTLLAQTAAFTPVAGWNTQNVLTPTLLPAGTYWLVFLPQNNSLAGRVALSGAGRHYSYTFGVQRRVTRSTSRSMPPFQDDLF